MLLLFSSSPFSSSFAISSSSTTGPGLGANNGGSSGTGDGLSNEGSGIVFGDGLYSNGGSETGGLSDDCLICSALLSTCCCRRSHGFLSGFARCSCVAAADEEIDGSCCLNGD